MLRVPRNLRKLSIAGLLSLALGGAAPPQDQAARQAAAQREYWNGCFHNDDAVGRNEGERQLAEYRRLEAVLSQSPGDPVADAKRAADTGDFRLFWSRGMFSASVAGLVCRIPSDHPSTGRSPLVLLERGVRHTSEACDFTPGGCVVERRLDAYAVGYNRELARDPRFPYPDLCRAPQQGDVWDRLTLGEPRSLAPQSQMEADNPRTLGEAVRRGSPASLRRWIERDEPGLLDRPDDFALTPLAWAALDGRDEAARMLLARGADPLAGCAPVRGYAQAVPLKIALELGRERMVSRMLTSEVEQRVRPWPQSLIEAAVKGDNVVLAKRMLAEEHERIFVPRLIELARDNRSPAMMAVLRGASADAAQAMLNVAVWKGDVALLREALEMGPDVNFQPETRTSPLAYAIINGGESTDTLVRMLLDRGANVDSPGTMPGSIGHQSGSIPATALVVLVATADRIYLGRAPDNAGRLRMEAQLRALDVLLDAGASVRARDDRGRPLAVLAVAGRYGPMTGGEKLPAEWFSRLDAAGVDFNETWQGSTALDWLIRIDPDDTATSQLLVSLGARRLQPVPQTGVEY